MIPAAHALKQDMFSEAHALFPPGFPLFLTDRVDSVTDKTLFSKYYNIHVLIRMKLTLFVSEIILSEIEIYDTPENAQLPNPRTCFSQPTSFLHGLSMEFSA